MTDKTELHEPTLRAAIEAVEKAMLGQLPGGVIGSLEAMIPKPVSWADRVVDVFVSEGRLEAGYGFYLTFARWLEANLDKLPMAEKVMSYNHAHEDAVAMGYPSLTEALEHLSSLREQPSRKAVSKEEIERAADELLNHFIKSNMSERSLAKAAIRRGIALAHTKATDDEIAAAEKRGMREVVEWLESDDWEGVAIEVRRHFGLGEK